MSGVERGILWGIVALGVLLRIGYALAIYEPSLLAYHHGDYTLYEVGAREILAGDFSLSNSLFLVRPAGFSLWVALLGGNPFAVLGVNLLLSALIIPLTYMLARQHVSVRLALTAAAIVALDPTSIKYAAVLLAEPLANVLLAVAFVALGTMLTDCPRPRWQASLLAALCIASSAFVRPAAYLLWIPLGLWMLFALRGRGWLPAAVMALICGASVGSWTLHNARTFGNPTYSTIGTYNLLYYRAASVLYQAGGRSIDEVYTELARRVEVQLGNPTDALDAGTRHRHYTPNPAQQSAMTQTALNVFAAHPREYMLTLPVGLARVTVLTGGYGQPLGALVWLWNMTLWGVAALGAWRMARARQWRLLSLALVMVAYFLAGTLWVQTSGIDTRATSMLTPILALLAAGNLPYNLTSFKHGTSK